MTRNRAYIDDISCAILHVFEHLTAHIKDTFARCRITLVLSQLADAVALPRTSMKAAASIKIVPISSAVPKGWPENIIALMAPTITSLMSKIPTLAGLKTRAGANVSQNIGKANITNNPKNPINCPNQRPL